MLQYNPNMLTEMKKSEYGLDSQKLIWCYPQYRMSINNVSFLKSEKSISSAGAA